MQNARENPLAAAAAAAVAGAPPAQGNAENLLDIDFDGAAPASAQKSPQNGLSGLEGLAGTPQRIASPAMEQPASAAGNLDDLMGLSNGTGQANGNHADILGGFAALDMSALSQPPPPQQQLAGEGGGGGKRTSQDLLDLF